MLRLCMMITGVAGGLTNLSKMPACNILVLGAQKKMLSGFSSTAVLPHTGFIYYSDMVQARPLVSEQHCGCYGNAIETLPALLITSST